MYVVKIYDLSKKIKTRPIVKEFYGPLDEEERKKWARIAKNAPTMRFELSKFEIKKGGING